MGDIILCFCGSFEGLLEEGIPLLTGSQLSEDLQKVIDGVKGLLEVRDMGLLDLTGGLCLCLLRWTSFVLCLFLGGSSGAKTRYRKKAIIYKSLLIKVKLCQKIILVQISIF